MTHVESTYDHAGGAPAIRHVVEVFYASVLADPVLRPLFGAGKPEHVPHLAAADTAGLPDDPRFRATLRSHVEFGTEVALQNSWAATDAELHPLREVPKWTWEEPEA